MSDRRHSSMRDRNPSSVDMDAIAGGRRPFAPFEGRGRTLVEDAPPLPQVRQDNRTSPFDVVPGEGQAFVTHVQSARLFLDWCREMINRHDELQQRSPPEAQDEMEKLLRELAGKVQQGARVQAIGEASVEVADILERL